MAIWRGTGGSGESSSDSTINITTQKAAEAAASAASALTYKTAAEAAKTAAETAETNAETAETNAETAASSASTSATAAASSATSASSSASTATTQASNASTSATNAASSASSASTSASNASTSASTATTKASEASTSATNAASSATSAATSATNAASSASSASTSASTATTKASEASTSATNAASSATAAASSASTASTQATNASNSASAAATSETNAASSATAAASSATSASNSATTATTQATNAASSASSASTSASTATTQASNAATSATNAASSASAASTSATSAASSATSAASSAASAAASLDSFDDRYLGSKTSNPTVDNDGNALATGALYYNSVEGEMRVYDGSQWIAASAASQAILTKYKYVATAGQTTFSGSDANSLTLSYTAGSIIVTLNGAVLDASDYTATTGTSVVLGVAATLNDEVNIFSFSTFDVANTYTQAQADAEFLRKAGEDGVTVSSGNLGLGVTPSAWNSAYKALQFGTTGALFGESGDAAVYLACNSFIDSAGTAKYLTTDFASRYNQENGAHKWLTAASGTAGNAITFTQAMTLDASGNLNIGGTGLSYRIGAFVSTSASLQNAFTVTNNANADFQIRIKNDETWAGTSAGSLIFQTGASERARIDTSGNLLVGATSYSGGVPNDSAIVIRQDGYMVTRVSGNGNYAAEFQNVSGTSVGNITVNASTTAYNTSSDYRLKENIAPMTGALAKVAALKPCTYTWKATGETSEGFIAHELAEVVAGCVTGEKDATRMEQYEISPAVPATYDEQGNELTPAVEAVMGEREVPVYQGIDTSFLVATLTAAIQEQQAIITQLQADVAALKGNA